MRVVGCRDEGDGDACAAAPPSCTDSCPPSRLPCPLQVPPLQRAPDEGDRSNQLAVLVSEALLRSERSVRSFTAPQSLALPGKVVKQNRVCLKALASPDPPSPPPPPGSSSDDEQGKTAGSTSCIHRFAGEQTKLLPIPQSPNATSRPASLVHTNPTVVPFFHSEHVSSDCTTPQLLQWAASTWSPRAFSAGPPKPFAASATVRARQILRALHESTCDIHQHWRQVDFPPAILRPPVHRLRCCALTGRPCLSLVFARAPLYNPTDRYKPRYSTRLSLTRFDSARFTPTRISSSRMDESHMGVDMYGNTAPVLHSFNVRLSPIQSEATTPISPGARDFAQDGTPRKQSLSQEAQVAQEREGLARTMSTGIADRSGAAASPSLSSMIAGTPPSVGGAWRRALLPKKQADEPHQRRGPSPVVPNPDAAVLDIVTDPASGPTSDRSHWAGTGLMARLLVGRQSVGSEASIVSPPQSPGPSRRNSIARSSVGRKSGGRSSVGRMSATSLGGNSDGRGAEHAVLGEVGGGASRTELLQQGAEGVGSVGDGGTAAPGAGSTHHQHSTVPGDLSVTAPPAAAGHSASHELPPAAAPALKKVKGGWKSVLPAAQAAAAAATPRGNMLLLTKAVRNQQALEAREASEAAAAATAAAVPAQMQALSSEGLALINAVFQRDLEAAHHRRVLLCCTLGLIFAVWGVLAWLSLVYASRIFRLLGQGAVRDSIAGWLAALLIKDGGEIAALFLTILFALAQQRLMETVGAFGLGSWLGRHVDFLSVQVAIPPKREGGERSLLGIFSRHSVFYERVN